MNTATARGAPPTARPGGNRPLPHRSDDGRGRRLASTERTSAGDDVTGCGATGECPNPVTWLTDRLPAYTGTFTGAAETERRMQT